MQTGRRASQCIGAGGPQKASESQARTPGSGHQASSAFYTGCREKGASLPGPRGAGQGSAGQAAPSSSLPSFPSVPFVPLTHAQKDHRGQEGRAERQQGSPW